MNGVTARTENGVAQGANRRDPGNSNQQLLFLFGCRHLNVGTDFIDQPLSNALHQGKIIDAPKWTVLRPVLNDRFGFTRSNSAHLSRNGLRIGCIDVDLAGDRQQGERNECYRSHFG